MVPAMGQQKNAIMKKITLFAAVAMMTALSFSSCKDKCTVCTWADGTPDTENCGSDQEQDAFVIATELAAAFSGTTVNCDKK